MTQVCFSNSVLKLLRHKKSKDNVTFTSVRTNDKFLDKSKLKAIANYKSNENLFWEILTILKRRKCWLAVFSSFPTMFSRGLRVIKVRIVW